MPGAALNKKWDTSTERDLCVAVIMGNNESEQMRYQWPKIHSFMQQLGYSFTRDAISQHFTKVIMKDFKSRHGGRPASKITKKTAGPPPKSSKGPPKRKQLHKMVDERVDDEDEILEFAPDGDRKRFKSEAIVKAEIPNFFSRERSATVADHDADFENWAHHEPI